MRSVRSSGRDAREVNAPGGRNARARMWNEIGKGHGQAVFHWQSVHHESIGPSRVGGAGARRTFFRRGYERGNFAPENAGRANGGLKRRDGLSGLHGFPSAHPESGAHRAGLGTGNVQNARGGNGGAIGKDSNGLSCGYVGISKGFFADSRGGNPASKPCNDGGRRACPRTYAKINVKKQSASALLSWTVICPATF